MADPFCNFYVGQKVVYKPTNASYEALRMQALAHQAYYPLTIPDVDGIYCVRELFWDSMSKRTGLRLKEIRNPFANFADGYKEPGFWHCDFRPVTDISSLEKLLKEANSGKDGNHSRRRRKAEVV